MKRQSRKEGRAKTELEAGTGSLTLNDLKSKYVFVMLVLFSFPCLTFHRNTCSAQCLIHWNQARGNVLTTPGSPAWLCLSVSSFERVELDEVLLTYKVQLVCCCIGILLVNAYVDTVLLLNPSCFFLGGMTALHSCHTIPPPKKNCD